MARLVLANSPILIFIGVWVTVFYINSLELYPFHKAGRESLVVLASGILSLVMGYILASLTFYNVPNQARDGKQANLPLFKIDVLMKLTIITLAFLAFGGLGSFRVISSLAGGAKYYFVNPFLIRELVVAIQLNEISNVPALYKISGFAISIGMISNIYGGSLFIYKGYRKIFALLPIIMTLFVSLVFIRRYSFVMGLTLWLTSYLYSFQVAYPDQSKILIRRMIIMTLIMAGTIFGVSYFVVHVRTFYHPKITEYFYESLYSYFVGGLSSLDVWLHNPNDLIEHTYGQTTFKDIFRWLSRFKLWPAEEVKAVHQEFVFISKYRMINTYTFVKAMYEDFNISGVLVLSFIWGFLSKSAVVRFFKDPDYVSLLMVTITTFSLLMSFYSFYFRNIMGPVFWLLCVGLIQKYIKSNESEPRPNSIQ